MSSKPNLTSAQLARYFDHTQLKAYVSNTELKQLCDESHEYGFQMVAINSAPVAYCHELLKNTPVHVGAAISFPLGQTTIESKLFETKNAIENGADEIDYVINIVELKNGNYDYIEREMKEIVSLCRKHGIISKVIFENCYLTEAEKQKLCEIANRVEPDFVKTSTGFGTGGATLADVKLMRAAVKKEIKVKAAGGIRDLDTCLAMIQAGAERIGSSSGIQILKEFEERFGKA